MTAELRTQWPRYLGIVWEQLARDAVPRLTIADRRYGPAAPWWGNTDDGQPVEFDIVAAAVDDRDDLLVGEVKLTASAAEIAAAAARLRQLAPRCRELAGRRIQVAVFVQRARGRTPTDVSVITAEDVIGRPPTTGRSRRRTR